MRINAEKAVCHCGRCGQEPVLYKLTLIADHGGDLARLEHLLATIKQAFEAEGNPAREIIETPKTAAKLQAAKFN